MTASLGATGAAVTSTGAAVTAGTAAASSAEMWQLVSSILSLGESATASIATVGKMRAEAIGYKAQRKLLAAQAADAIGRGSMEAAERMRQARLQAGAARAGYAAQGVAVGAGTPAEVAASTEFMGTLDAATIRANAFREAMGFRMERENVLARRRLERTAAWSTAGATAVTGGMRFAKDVWGKDKEEAK